MYTREGNDDFRAQFVGAQNTMEHVLAAQKILQIVPTILGAIHTPLSATPLCTQLNSTQLADLMAPSLRHDKDKLTTVADRAVSIKAQQANNPQEKSVWGIWFGPLSQLAVKNRVKETNDYNEFK